MHFLSKPEEGKKTNVLELQNYQLPGSDALRYTFDACYDSNASQDLIFDQEVKEVLPSVLKGIHTTVFAYGITGSGKTHTMQGNEKSPGLIPRAAEHLLQTAQAERSETCKIEIKVSYLEIYNEKIMDLLVPPAERKVDLPIREAPSRAIVIPSLTERSVSSLSDFLDAYRDGCKNRTVASTRLNPESSRSHAVLILKAIVRQKKEDKVVMYTGKLHLIDLAGSEDNRRTGNTGVRLTESSNINTSLFVLGKVVDALNCGATRVPYRDSKLTRLLQDSLGGRSIGILFANIAPAIQYYSDTTNTLNFASKSRQIINQPQVNKEVSHSVKKVTTVRFNQPPLRPEKRKERSSNRENYSNSSSTSYSSFDQNALAALERRIETKLGKQLENQLICPQIKKRKLVDEATMQRLERLEKKVVEQAQDAAHLALGSSWQETNTEREMEEEEEEEKKKGGGLITPRLLCAMTPCTKARTARNYILEAKTLESGGHEQKALVLYEKAAEMIPENGKLQQKISILRQQSSSSSSSLSSLSSSPSESVMKKRKLFMDGSEEDRQEEEEKEEKEYSSSFVASEEEEDSFEEMETDDERVKRVLQVLSTGDKKQLLSLKGIGPKRADAIMTIREQKTLKTISDLEGVIGFGPKFLQTFSRENL
eukprot:CAMPEP_0201478804 /NCGR_PEP_ID=MMETSP0151_2-20130828/3572_1 /ASSEMBLY_ACC=CAM_ASM_000257 /TAXON_ID=200890 /ORGANISM="Paramoeba atlantica, Strain 621/1 / CCAP 1560/9" /LENGTH=651 /DNA_ID=CAMNT_0047860009 /DNA_START=230 /DNA_END=2186 /DNA_ORIENTATION=+